MCSARFTCFCLCTLLALLLGASLSTACGGGGPGPGEPPTEPPPEPPPPEPPPPEPPPPEPPPWPPMDPLASLREVSDGRFATSLLCARCHDNADGASAMRDDQGRAIAPFDLWRASMMSNASRDPFWRAVLSAEMADNPSASAAIADTCMACHTPMARYQTNLEGALIAESALAGDTDRTQIALDGVSCTLCHQVTDTGFGDASSFTAGFEIDAGKLVYGTHPSPNPAAMRNFSGYTPVYSMHTHESALCGTCHSVFTSTLDATGTPTGDGMPEQTPYLEWRNSIYTTETAAPAATARVCVDCHLPSLDVDGNVIQTKIAHNPDDGDFGPGMAPVRNAFHRHVFVGGNTLLPQIIADAANRLQPNASPSALAAKAATARQYLRTETATLSVRDVSREQGDLVHFTVRVENRAGHKFPTGYPSRRAWLRVRVKNAAGAVVFRSGEFDTRGRLVSGSTAGVLPAEAVGGPILPHYAEINAQNQVQVYEPIMKTPAGDATHGLMRAAGYLKDNRLLPLGWSTVHADAAATAPQGGVTADGDFVAGRDDVRYVVSAPAAAGPHSVEVTLLYQVLGTRHVAELLEHDTRAMADFRRYYQAADPRPEVVDQATAALP